MLKLKVKLGKGVYINDERDLHTRLSTIFNSRIGTNRVEFVECRPPQFCSPHVVGKRT